VQISIKTCYVPVFGRREVEFLLSDQMGWEFDKFFRELLIYVKTYYHKKVHGAIYQYLRVFMHQIEFKVLIRYAAAFLFTILTQNALCEQIAPPRLQIVVPMKNSRVNRSDDLAVSNINSCKKFTKHLLKNAGLQSTGPFVAASCTKSVAAIPPKTKGSEVIRFDWQLVFKVQRRGGEGFIKANLKYVNGSESIDVGNFEIASSLSLEDVFASAKLAPIIAQRIALMMPFQSIVLVKNGIKKVADLDLSSFRYDSRADKAVGQDPVIKAFLIRTESGLFKVDLLGTLKRRDSQGDINASKSKKIPTGQVNDVSRSSSTGPTWEFDSKALDFEAEKIQNEFEKIPPRFFVIGYAENKDKLIVKIENHFVSTQDQLAKNRSKNALDVLGRSFLVGTRFGYPILGGQTPFAKSYILGLFLEMRSGFLDGFRFSYDWIPKREVQIDTRTITGSLSVLQLGYAFDLHLDSILLTSIDAMPRIGVTNLSVVEDQILEDNSVQTSKFIQQRAPTFGLEVGLEKQLPLFLLRLWGYASRSTGFTSVDKKYRTTSTKLGLNNYLQVTDFGGVKMALYGFSAWESTTITVTASEDELAEDAALGVSLSNFYLGVGLTLTN
jgi:hypothetical protein